MASSVPAATLLDKLPARPPTPPRETHLREPSELRKSVTARPSPLHPLSRPCLQTPPPNNVDSPALSDVTNRTQPTSERMEKRVVWSGHTEYREAPDYKNGAEKFYKSSPLSAPSSATSKPLKSILKPSSSPNPLATSIGSQLDGTGEQINITEMLDSTIKQLAGSDRDSKLDAYMTLSRALKASNNLPDRVALREKMSLLMQFIQRDLSAKNANGSLDTSLVNHALTLLATFLHFQSIASTITSDFAIFIIDHSIRTFEDQFMQKDVVRHFMQVVALQGFPAKVMTSDRVGRLVASLHKIEDHMKGKSIIMSRIHIYRRLVKQCHNQMLVHCDWLKDLFTDMLSTVKDIRQHAIQLGLESGYTLRSGNQLMRKAHEILQTSSDEQTYIDFYIQRLQEMVKDKQRAASMPQIWSVVTSFLRQPLDRWDYFAPWFQLIQAAFNTSDSLTRQEANYAWNKYVYLNLTETKPTAKSLSSLCKPLTMQLKRKTSVKHPGESRKLRQTVIGGICNLYYYTFRPGSERSYPHEIPWDVVVQPMIAQLVGLDESRESQSDDILQASRILASLLQKDVSYVSSTMWREDRVMENPPAKPEELPSIESKWVRKNSDRIFKAVGPIMDKTFLDLSHKDSLIYRLWHAVVGSVAAASAKDIKVSEDTAKFFARALALLSNVWTKGCSEAEDVLISKFYPSVRNFVKILVDGLGLLPFTEKKLSMTVSNEFEPVATPSHRPEQVEKPQGVVRNPLQHLFAMLSSIPPGGSDDKAFSEFFQSCFEPFFVGKSDKVRLGLTRDLLRLLPDNTLSPFASWDLGAQAVQLSLLPNATQSAEAAEKLPGPEFREIVSFLERGLTSHPNLPSDSWLSLFDALAQRVTDGFGDAGRAIVIVEPLAKALVEEFRSDQTPVSLRNLSAARVVLASAKLPRDRQALDVARRRVWGVPAVTSKVGSTDPFDNLYKVANVVLDYCYQKLHELDQETVVTPIIESAGALVVGSFATMGFATMQKLQKGLSTWVQDEQAQLKLNNQSSLCTSIRELWTKLCAELARKGHLDKAQFEQVESLLTAAFKSKHRFIVSKAAETWNTIVKDEESPECSDSLKSVVSSLQSRVDVVVPGAESASGDFGAQATSFLDSQEEVDGLMPSSGESQEPQKAKPDATPTVVESLRASSTRSSRKRPLEVTPEPAVTRSSKRATRAKRTSTPRLRHDNSQVQFEPIPTSSPRAEDSQHLTERQKEIRERQKETTSMFPGMGSSSPQVAVDTPTKPEEAPVPESKDNQPEVTPKRSTSYGELISSTPTPRRGQVLPMEADNDPPSSPPEPRPNPLFSEIQSRSRTNSSLENWDFSSPPVSPVTSRQQVIQDVELPQIALTDDSTQRRTRSQAKNRKSNASAAVDEPSPSCDVIPSSIPKAASQSSVVTRASRGRNKVVQAPSTPPPKSAAPPVTAHDTPKSGEDEFVDAPCSPEHSSPVLPTIESAADEESKDTSFAFSVGDDSQLMNLVVELESRPCNMPFYKSSSPLQAENCITVQTDSPSPTGQPAKVAKQIEESQDRIPSTPAEASVEAPEEAPAEASEEASSQSQGEKKRKRKTRGSKSYESRRKRRKSTEQVPSSQLNEPEEAESEGANAGSSQEVEQQPLRGMRTRQKVRDEQEKPAEVQKPAPRSKGRKKQKVDAPKEEGDTDEEVMSQLMTESNAASQSRAASVIEDSMDVVPTDERVPEPMEEAGPEVHAEPKPEPETEAEKAAEDAESILGRLKGGLDGLRNASLSRADVYKIEDMLMDMKRELFEAERRGRESV